MPLTLWKRVENLSAWFFDNGWALGMKTPR